MPSKKILIADNYRAGREALADLLRDEGFSVTTTRQTAFAKDLVVACAPNVVILGMGRSERAALNLIAHLRRLAPQTTVISMAGSREISLARAALEAGAMAYLPKPLHYPSLLVALRPLLSVLTQRDLGAES